MTTNNKFFKKKLKQKQEGRVIFEYRRIAKNHWSYTPLRELTDEELMDVISSFTRELYLRLNRKIL